MIGDVQDFETAKTVTFANKARIWTSTGKGGSGFERIGGTFPQLAITPKFKISKDAKFFTIGSCFAREVEAALQRLGVECLTSRAKFPGDYFATAKTNAENGALNVYTPASMLSLVSILSNPDPENVGSLQVGEEWCDMLLSGFRLLNRSEFETAREVLLSTYRTLPGADVIVITLGYTEAWYDTQDQIYVNRSPAATLPTMRLGGRYNFHNFSAPQVMETLDRIIEKVRSLTSDHAKIIITTSPVPLHGTFTERDVITANTYSKCTLVSSAVWLSSKYDFVDYFPSYEFVTHMPRANAYMDDGVHVKREVVDGIMKTFADAYIE